jgi:GT2 family glycosyltransferase
MKARDIVARDSHGSATRLLAVVVIYKMQPRDSSTLQTLVATAENISPDELDLKILIWDNTPGGQDVGELPTGVLYEPAPHNPGLAQAYNRALELAETEGYDWLLTLDQDSFLPANFLARIANLTRELSPTLAIGAIAPQVIADGRNISPFRFMFGAIPRWFNYGFVGVSESITIPVNSGTTLRVTALRQIGGYDPMFPLDVSDIDLFYRLQNSGKRVYIAGDLLVHHDLALLRKDKRMSLDRYRALLLDECAFWDMNLGSIARFERKIRLAGRICKDILKSEQSDFRKRTLLELKRRLLTPRRERITEWRAWATLRCDSSGKGENPRSLPINTSSAQRLPLQEAEFHISGTADDERQSQVHDRR